MSSQPSPDSMRDRFRGCLLGGAIGDALGAPVEFISRSEILDQFGPAGITAPAPAYGRVGAITDDTQMTLFTAEGLLRGWAQGCAEGHACLVQATHDAYRRWLLTQDENPDTYACAGNPADEPWLLQHRALHALRGPGHTCLTALQAARARAVPAGNDRKGCGGVMRVAPVGLFMWRPGEGRAPEAVFRLAADLAGLTHGHPTGRLAAGVLAVVVHMLAHGTGLEDALAIATGILARHADHEETRDTVEQAMALARSAVPREQAVAALGQGWIAEEALAISIYCSLVAQSFADGVILAVNHDGDSDSTGAITGNLLGGIHGESAIPAAWLGVLELREVIGGMADRLLASAA